MAIRQRGGSWQADATVNGRRKRKDFPSKEAAEAWLDGLKKPAKARAFHGQEGPTNGPKPGHPEAPPKTFKEACERTFSRYYKGTKYELKTWQLMNRVREDVGDDRPLEEIDNFFLDGLLEKWKGAGKASSTINARISIISKSLRYAKTRGSRFELPKFEREKMPIGRVRWLTGAEETTILGLCRQWSKTDHEETIIALIDTGLRPSELYALRNVPTEVNAAAGAIYIWEAKNEKPGTVLMTDRVKAIFARRVQSTAPGELLFPYDNHWMLNVWDRIRVVMKMENDPNFVPYICRHTCASRLVQRGVPLHLVKEWMRHKTIQMTMRYAHLAPHNFKQAAEALNLGATD